jgi:hypothetical protein
MKKIKDGGFRKEEKIGGIKMFSELDENGR